MQFDIVLRDEVKGLMAIIEIKASRDPWSAEEAAEYRSSLLASLPVRPRYFLLLTPEQGYLWMQDDAIAPPAPPRLSFPMAPIVTGYFDRSGRERPSRPEFESLVFRWLLGLVSRVADGQETGGRETEDLLAACGFIDDIQGSLVLPEAAA
ncbi:MAG: hypothetical protein PWP23_1299 [Candidatus Sumerlaeota bacterium]|nr:hypothetical protein [Candidatus Sumerlaeota bacterium]